MKGILSVVGKDKIGIIAKFCLFLSEQNINILDISQTVVSNYFNMMMIVDLSSKIDEFEKIQNNIQNIAKELNVEAKLQREDIFENIYKI